MTAFAQNDPGMPASLRFRESLLLRLEYTTLPSVGSNLRQDCIIVAKDGWFHMERHQTEGISGAQFTDVFEGNLNEQDLSGLGGLLQDQAFASLAVGFDARSYGGGGMNSEVLIGEIGREGSPQHFSLISKEQWKENRKAVEPVLKWFNSIQKRKLPKLKNSPITRCMDIKGTESDPPAKK